MKKIKEIQKPNPKYIYIKKFDICVLSKSTFYY